MIFDQFTRKVSRIMTSASSRLVLRRPASRRRFLLIRVSSLVMAVAAACGSTQAASAASPAVLDQSSPLAVAAYGSSLAWLRPGARGDVALVVRADSRSAPRVVVPSLPRRASQLTLGTDAHGRLIAVITAVGSGPRTALFSVPADGSGRVRRLRLASAHWYAYAPGLRNGIVSFVRRGRGDVDGHASAYVMVGRLGGSRARVAGVLRFDYLHAAQQTAVAADGIVLVAHVEQVDFAGSVSRLISYRAGRRLRILVRDVSHTGDGKMLNFGASGLGPIVLDAAGRHATIARWAAPTDPNTGQPVRGPRDLVTVDVAGGQRTTQPVPAGLDIALPLPGEGFAVYDASHDEYKSGPDPARDMSGALGIAP